MESSLDQSCYEWVLTHLLTIHFLEIADVHGIDNPAGKGVPENLLPARLAKWDRYPVGYTSPATC